MPEPSLSRRSLLVGGALVVATGLAVPGPTAGAVGPRPAVRLSLPAPTGGYPVGTTSLHLVDGSRVDPLAPTAWSRELMVHSWYPAARSGRHRVARYMPPTQAGALSQHLNALLGTDYPDDVLTFPTHSRAGAPVANGPRRPVLLFSHGFGLNTALYTGIMEELASRGYVVAGVDHTFDAAVVEFPGGRIETQSPEPAHDPVRLAVRVPDLRFVLDQLTAVAAGSNPDAGNRPLPEGLGRVLDLGRVAAFGHSLGSPTVVSAIDADPRFDAGVALDGTPLGQASLDRPFLMLGNQDNGYADEPDWAAFYDRLRGPRRYLVIDGALHNDFGDLAVFNKVIDLRAVFALGTIDGVRALTVQRRYLTAWFDRALRGRPSPLLRGESPRFPEVDFQP